MGDSFYVTYQRTCSRNFVKTMCSPNCFEQCIMIFWELKCNSSLEQNKYFELLSVTFNSGIISVELFKLSIKFVPDNE